MICSLENVRVLFCCTGVGIFNRGIETFFRDAFDGLKFAPGIEAQLIKGAKEEVDTQNIKTLKSIDPISSLAPEFQPPTFRSGSNERVVRCLPRTGRMAPLIGHLTGRSAYAVEQWSSFPGVVREILRFRPHVVFTSEANLMFLLRRFRRQIGVPFRVLYSNGGPVHPPFNRHDMVHQVAPLYREEALAAGESSEKHILVPYGIRLPAAPHVDPAAKLALRVKLGLPTDRPVILSVGWIARRHKRMDYIVREVALATEILKAGTVNSSDGITTPKAPFLQLLGAMDDHSREVILLAEKELGRENFNAQSVHPDEVAQYYRAADIFVLGSLAEGFGRVYLEALMHGLPTIGHRHPVIEYVLGEAGILADLSRSGVLAETLCSEIHALRGPSQAQADRNNGLGLDDLQITHCPATQVAVHSDSSPPVASALARRRWSYVRDQFGWDVLRPHYIDMFRRAAAAPLL